MKNLKFPTAQSILLIIAGCVALLTYMVPAGQYDTLSYNKTENTFLKTAASTTVVLPATQNTLDSLQIKIPLEKFTSGDLWKPIGIPNTYKRLESRPQGLIALIKSPIQGIIEASDIIFLVLIIGGLIGIINHTGAFEAGISWLSVTLRGREYWLIISVTFLIALGGTSFGLAEETIAFYPILIPVFLAAKYDAMVPLASIYLGSSVGTMCSTVNPFSSIIASDAAGINWTAGLNFRLVMFVLCTAICLIYILRYARRVKQNPSVSIIYNQKTEIEQLFGTVVHSNAKLNHRMRFILLIFISCFIVMIYGVSRLGWWFIEMTSVFFVGAVLIGLISHIKESEFVDVFVRGAGDLLGVALIIGIARGISVLMDNGLISDTMLYYGSQLTDNMNKGIFANAMIFVYSGLSFFIPSSSGMAVLTMPIMAPLSDGIGVSREVVVNAYQYGMGLFAFINPTGLILPSLAIVKVGFNRWLKFVTPLLIVLTLFTMLMMTVLVFM
ncbi:YfcC family protein [Aestuariivivens sediminicola]|uniref:YfcC family protein n=1 Tax=Aestuariivivens sediminicola TaxID=2913560 RepID=UPI001F5AF1F5|nr:YfcC family protein [Aestuariivivens sediminicola]